MRSPHRVDIKAIIDELGRQAVHLQEQRLALIDEIRADPSYNNDVQNAPPIPEVEYSYQNDLSFYQPRQYQLSETVLNLMQRVLVVEASLLRIREKTAELDALIAPIQVLPDEVLGVMFEVTSRPESEPSKSSYISWDSERRVPLPIILASVSRRWRHVALSRSSLWTNIYLTPWQPRTWTELALSRSDSQLLDVTIDYCTEYGPKAAALDDLLDIVFPRIAYWKSLKIVTHHVSVLSHVAIRLQNAYAPNLTSLRLSLTGSGPPGNQLISLPLILQGGAPALSRLHVDSVGVAWLSRPFEGLTVLDLRWLWSDTKLSYQQLRGLLAASPSLRKLVLRGLYVELNPAVCYPSIQISSLVSLELSGDNVSFMRTLLDVPALEELSLVNVDEAEYRELMRSFDPPTRRSYPHLRTLSYLNVRTTPSMERFFEAIPDLELLTIVHSAVTRFLPILSNPRGFLPKLQTLTVLDDAPEQILLETVLNRKEMGYPLQRLNVHAGSMSAHYIGLLQQHVKLDGIYFRDRSR
ncbi:hypothetical protein BDY19DRAFT_749975 [Irpex rosettiformis]|uniref:Uncharacterized protein n=1 Tax=Irpex rosettiformis TaxID=378272 RepID=A0ACB8U747_9APHY|nr:hypothetical protein BDY19DRAFT_749975 [Irpex rosettiformis]